MKTYKCFLEKKQAPGQVFTLPSRTIPDSTMPLKTILERYARGLPIDGLKTPVYDETNELPDLRTLDLSEQQALRQAVAQQIDDMRQSLSNLKPDPLPDPTPDKPDTQNPDNGSAGAV